MRYQSLNVAAFVESQWSFLWRDYQTKKKKMAFVYHRDFFHSIQKCIYLCLFDPGRWGVVKKAAA